jgi:acyl-CoA thioesterase
MTFDQLLSAVRSGNELTISSDWSQGRASFGGLTAGLVFARMQGRVANERPVRSMQVSFVGPVEASVPAVFETEILREGRAVSQVMGRIIQNDETRLVCMASFAGDRESVVNVEALPAPEAKPVEQCNELPYIKGITPGFIQYIALRWAFGDLPFTGKGGREMGGWMRFREPPEAITDAHLIALIDGWPPAILTHLKAPAPASSLSWTLEIMHPRPNIQPEDWLLYRAITDHAESGYGHVRAEIRTAAGELVALSRQTVAVFG